jgi:hypothetical protein
MRPHSLAVLVFIGVLAAAAPSLLAKPATLTGTVGDAMCGVKHMMPNDVACTEACVKKGADYALIVNDKAYALKATDQQKAQLNKLAGKSATIAGDLNNTTLTVSSVKAAK